MYQILVYQTTDFLSRSKANLPRQKITCLSPSQVAICRISAANGQGSRSLKTGSTCERSSYCGTQTARTAGDIQDFECLTEHGIQMKKFDISSLHDTTFTTWLLPVKCQIIHQCVKCLNALKSLHAIQGRSVGKRPGELIKQSKANTCRGTHPSLPAMLLPVMFHVDSIIIGPVEKAIARTGVKVVVTGNELCPNTIRNVMPPKCSGTSLICKIPKMKNQRVCDNY